MSQKLKFLICSPKDDPDRVTSIANQLGQIVYSSLKLNETSKSSLRIIETMIDQFQIELWHLTDQLTNNLPAICMHHLDGLILVSNDSSIANFLNSNSHLFNQNRRLPILWLSKQFDSMDNIEMQSNYNSYNIHQLNSSNASLDSIQNEFNKWLIQTYSS